MDSKIGHNLQTIRKQKGITQLQLALLISELSGTEVQPYTISRYERGLCTIPASFIHHAASAMNVSAQGFYDFRTTADDKRAIMEYAVLPEREKNIIRYLFTRWAGDIHAMIHFVCMYISVKRKYRADFVGPALVLYRYMVSAGRVDASAPVPDLAYLDAACERLWRK